MEKIKVKISTNFPTWPLIRQTPGSLGIWGNCQFYIDDDTKDCDWWVVIDGIPKEQKAICDPDKTILITCEPSSIKTYQKDFLKQFNTIVTTQKSITAPNIINLQLLPWFVGANYDSTGNKYTFSKDYDELKQITNISKTKLISIISSKKTVTKGHRQRFDFTKALKEHFGNKIDLFGSGINFIADKWDGLSPYKYSIVIENSVCENYWTEKLADSLLSGTYPFYFGCPNIDDYFPTGSMTKIDIKNPREAIETIENGIDDDLYEKHFKQIEEARTAILDHYQIFPQLQDMINDLQLKTTYTSKSLITIKPEKIKTNNFISKILSKL